MKFAVDRAIETVTLNVVAIDLKLVFITSCLMLSIKGQCGAQVGKFTCCAIGKGI